MRFLVQGPAQGLQVLFEVDLAHGQAKAVQGGLGGHEPLRVVVQEGGVAAIVGIGGEVLVVLVALIVGILRLVVGEAFNCGPPDRGMLQAPADAQGAGLAGGVGIRIAALGQAPPVPVRIRQDRGRCLRCGGGWRLFGCEGGGDGHGHAPVWLPSSAGILAPRAACGAGRAPRGHCFTFVNMVPDVQTTRVSGNGVVCPAKDAPSWWTSSELLLLPDTTKQGEDRQCRQGAASQADAPGSWCVLPVLPLGQGA